MNEQPAFETTSGAINWLREQGFTYDFNVEKDCITGPAVLSPKDFTIDYVFRFEGATDPGDEEVVYGISSATGDIKGIIMNAYGMYGDALTEEMIQKLQIKE